jgi:hypothetical protein
MDIFSDYILEFPLLKTLVENTRTTVASGMSLLNVDCDLKAFLASEEPKLLIRKCVSDFDDNVWLDPAFLQQDHIILCNDFGGPVIALGQTKMSEDNASLYSSPGEVLLGAVSAGGFPYQFHDVAGDWNHEIFSPNVSLIDSQACHCSVGDTVLVPISRIFDYRSTGDVVIKIAAPSSTGLMWEFNRTTGFAERVHASTIEATTLSYIINFLSIYGNENSINAIKHLVKHPFYYIRWSAVQAVGKIDAEILTDILLELKNDSHPHISAASKKMLSQLGVV